MAYDEPGYRPPLKKKKPLPGTGGIPFIGGPLPGLNAPAIAATPGFVSPQPGVIDWRQLIESDPLYKQGLVDIGADSAGDRARTLAALRSALARFGGQGLAGIAGKLGPGWEDLLDPTTIGAAAAGDTAGTTAWSQLEKAHKDRLLAEEDIRAARGILSSGQTGYEIGRARQEDTIARENAVQSLLELLSGATSAFAGREGDRNFRRGQLGDEAARRVGDLGLEPPAPKPISPLDIIAALMQPKKKKRPTGLVE